ncbi:MAG TPA: D-lyxose/D-mannose family sugar isomerase [Candidatus Limiplasma sp.]|nr:D-lyxose/D-mannose family sugar isomerase [Candidatus Limiplasma sp.]HRX08874.1 D-lyxose/D-mannose family sugar isomerase [Candidatus Limiplasma sp.]
MNDQQKAAALALDMLKSAGIALTKAEEDRLEIAGFGLGKLLDTGLELITYVNTERCCAKELVLLPRQTCPEHRHPPGFGGPGKEETFRCRAGEVYLYVEGDPTPAPKAVPPKGDEAYYTVHHEIILRPGEQYTLMPNTLHWFQGGPDGAIVSEFSTASHDDTDVFTHPGIIR